MGLTHDYGGAARTRCFTGGWDVAAKLCDHCHSAPALLFCRVDSAFFCMPCDAKVHHTLKHDRVWMCEVCEQAPAAVTCKADAAALCVACDTDIHSANPLARRHERSAVVPFSDTAESMVIKSTAAMFAGSDTIAHRKTDAGISESWLSTESIITTKFPAPEMKSMEFLFSDSDQFLDFGNYQTCSQPNYSDSVVPAVQTAVKPPFSAQLTNQHSPGNRFEIDFTRSNITSCNNSYSAQSLSHSVSSSCVDVGVVPDGSAAMSEIFPSTDLSGSQMDREARVLRYKEKRKNRKFEKTIRYASRKAYAETRPRIKGRFVKRSDSESDINGIFNIVSRSLIGDSRYGVVPSF